MEETIPELDFFVLNGDIFDFKWSNLGGVEQTTLAAVAWLDDLCGRFRDTHIHYVQGNHDYRPGFNEAMMQLSEMRKNLTIHPWFVKLEDTVFLHGDAGEYPDPKDLKAYRDGYAQHHPKGKIMGGTYGTLARMKMLPLSRPWINMRKMIRNVDSYLDAELEDIDDVSEVHFGHTHFPFTDKKHNGRNFHNTGCTVHGMKPCFHDIELG